MQDRIDGPTIALAHPVIAAMTRAMMIDHLPRSPVQHRLLLHE